MRRVAAAARLCDAFARPGGDAARSFAGRAFEAPSEWVTGNMAAVLTGVSRLEFLPWALPATPPHGHVRVAMQRVGICGSDVHYLQRGRIGDFVVNGPLVLGHEASGEVVQLGGGVLSLRVGARVALEVRSHPASYLLFIRLHALRAHAASLAWCAVLAEPASSRGQIQP
jgi:NADPH:quinone reductase-like Zn-dependent oxidoreductase